MPRIPSPPESLDAESRGWVDSLRSEGHAREDAVARLHALLLRAARFEVARRRATVPDRDRGELDDIALQSADDALVAVLAKLDDFRGRAEAEQGELLGAVRRAIDEELTAHQREVLIAVALNDVPIDVLAERLASTRGALYKTIHDARRKLRRRLQADGLT